MRACLLVVLCVALASSSSAASSSSSSSRKPGVQVSVPDSVKEFTQPDWQHRFSPKATVSYDGTSGHAYGKYTSADGKTDTLRWKASYGAGEQQIVQMQHPPFGATIPAPKGAPKKKG